MPFTSCAALAVAVVMLLVSQGAAAPNNAFHVAINKGSLKAFKKALEDGVDINQQGAGGQTPLMMAVLQGKVEMVKVALAADADTTIGENDGYTAVHGASFQGRPKIMEMLIAHGLDPNDKHNDGFTPIHRATWGTTPGHTETVKVLLEHGVVPDIENGADKALSYKKIAGTNKATARLLKEWQAEREGRTPEGHVEPPTEHDEF